MTRLVTDLPIWTDCPYQHPKAIEVRKGKITPDEPEYVVLWDPKKQKHVSMEANNITSASFKAAKLNLRYA